MVGQRGAEVVHRAGAAAAGAVGERQPVPVGRLDAAQPVGLLIDGVACGARGIGHGLQIAARVVGERDDGSVGQRFLGQPAGGVVGVGGGLVAGVGGGGHIA